ncbi:hypothetical protein CRE_02856 [Caenorhabditis remanei]|uniref:BHLH domain-containing protein n=1 Tax=Caenorhabditis remanei TaxID=31234 RepID=E3LW94_CAERE|nr:hypothetical protein CRE_02856 [Caenorhabditis remanei]
MDSISPIIQKEKTRKQLAEERRNNAFIAAVGDIKEELIQRGFGKEEDLGSQPAVLMCVAETLNQVDLKSKYPAEARRKSEGGKMPREKEKMVKATREQMRRNKKNAAIESLREFINRKELGDKPSKRLEQLEVVNTILEHLRTLPVNSIVTPPIVQQPFRQFSSSIVPSPTSFSQPRRATGAFDIDSLLQKLAPTIPPQSPCGLPTLVPTPPLVHQDPVSSPVGPTSPGIPDVFPTLPLVPQFNFSLPASLFPMMPLMDPARIQMQVQLMRNQNMLQNLMNPIQVTQTEKEE